MSSDQPVIFISHATEEGETANAVEQLLLAAFGDEVKIFNTSNARSLTAGDPWREQITSSLAIAEVALVLLSPRSVNNNWINFEAGGAWLNGVRLIPCCVRGMMPTLLKRPFADLQAVDLNDVGGIMTLVSHLSRTLKCTPIGGFNPQNANELLKASWQKDAQANNLELIDWYSKVTLRPARYKGTKASGLFSVDGFKKTVRQEIQALPESKELGLAAGETLRGTITVFSLPKEIELNRSVEDRFYCYMTGAVADLLLDIEHGSLVFGTIQSFGLIDTSHEEMAEAKWRCGWLVLSAKPAQN